MGGMKGNAGDLHDRLVQEVRSLRTGAEWMRWLDAAAKFHEYSFRNVVLIAMQKPEASWVTGYNSWRKLGRQVKKGERGIEILAPMIGRSSVDPTAAVEITTGGDERPRRGKGPLIGFRVARVWDISQTSGDPLPAPPAPGKVAGSAPTGLWDALAHEVASARFELAREPMRSEDVEGYTNYQERRVVVGDHLDDVTAVARLAHEVTHMSMHQPDDVAAAGSVMCRGIREVEAESVAYVLLAHHGLTIGGSSFPYVAGWAATVDSAEPEKVVQQTGQRVVHAARKLIDSTSQHLKPANQAVGEELSPGRQRMPVSEQGSIRVPAFSDVGGPQL